ncbi:MAG: type VI secretion system tube protein Hcp [Ilumatobacter sp.]|uniref:type VI secretion system tube protein Hcp n=1 Tax=Ilumatobacter sp. TaxID=1967498 RepID=UPI0026093DC1|nr:type VI secretion system tube protein Hcp [Ilumatobacter sp.]MDJ0767182.1 type VI secretion system tube protein Hcp [Ilumatobacter sp.]
MPILVKIDGLNGHGDAIIAGYGDGDWFTADSFSFGVEREMKESGEKGGTEDINIGVGELQECTISKSMDAASAVLAQYAVNGNSAGGAQIDFLQMAGGDQKPTVYLRYKLDRCFVKSWSTSGDADDRPTEEVAFYFNKIAFAVAGGGQVFGWDDVKNTKWDQHELEPIPSPG